MSVTCDLIYYINNCKGVRECVPYIAILIAIYYYINCLSYNFCERSEQYIVSCIDFNEGA